MKNGSIDMCRGTLVPKILLFTVPVMLMNLLQLFYNTADIVVLGRTGSALSVGAVGATSTVITLIINTFMGMAAAIITGLLAVVFSHQLMELYIPGKEEAISYGIIRLKYICI